MGTMETVLCPCGFSTSLTLGCGMAGPTPFYSAAMCRSCKSVVMVNTMEETLRCSTCHSPEVTPYDDPSLFEAKTHVNDKESFSSMGNNRNYLCPKCNKMSLQFMTNGFWD